MTNKPRFLPCALALLIFLVGLPVAGLGQSGSANQAEQELIQLLSRIKELQNSNQEAKAVPLVERALALAGQLAPPEDPRYISVLLTAGNVYSKIQNSPKAELHFRNAVNLAEKSLPQSHPLVFASLANLALFYRGIATYDQAAPLLARVVALLVKLQGAEALDVFVFLKLQAESHYYLGEYAIARPLFEQVIAQFEKTPPADIRLYFAAQNDLGETYKMTGDYVRAAQLQKRLLDLKLKALPPNDPSIATTLSNAAETARMTHNFEQALPLYQRALAIYEKALGSDSAEVATVLNQIGLLLSDAGDLNRAEPFFQRALKIREKKFGADSFFYSQPLLNLAWLYFAKGDYARAEPLYLRVLAIAEKTQGRQHLNVGTILAHLSMMYEAKGDIEKAVRFQTRSNDIGERGLSLILAQGSEQQKLLYMSTVRGETYGTISLHLRSGPANVPAGRLALTTILRRKGRVQDIMGDSIGILRRRSSPEDRALVDRLSALRSQLANFTLRGAGPETPEQRQTATARLETEIAQLESNIGRRSADFRSESIPVTIEQVQAALPVQAALVEFVFFQPFKIKAGDSTAFDAPRYAAYILHHEGPPTWVDLGEAAAIDEAATRWRAALRDRQRADVKQLARELDEKLMRPVRALLGNARQVLLSPDASLNLLPFSALVDEHDQFLIDKFSFSYLTSGRDLLRMKTASTAKSGSTVIVANPLYDLTNRSAAAPIATQTNLRSFDFSQARFSALPGTADEARALKAILPEAKLITGALATEGGVKGLAAPGILHIATHGFFLANQMEQAADPRSSRLLEMADQPRGLVGRIENPLLRSGLALAGANQRQGGEGNDGILTAMETAGLNLWGTKLVVLSACETGLGEASNGDGVYGLRRALVLAGAESQVMTLWQVNDLATSDLMTAYYRRLKAGEGRSEALRQVQLEMMRSKDRHHPFFWASFIPIGDWRDLSNN